MRWIAVAPALAGILVASVPARAAVVMPKVPLVSSTLPNGLRLVVSEDHSAPVATVAVYYGVGFRIEPKGRTGFAHLFEHMMFQGSSNVKKFEHAKYVEANGGNLNGSTRLDHTNYYQDVPADRVELALWLESDRMRSLDVSEENLDNQKKVVSEEVRVNVLNQPYGAFEWLDLWMNANQNWPNAHNFYGDLTELEAATIGDVREFFKRYYAPNNAVLVVVGDVDPSEISGWATKYFADIPRGATPPAPDVTEPPQTKEKRLRQKDALANLPALAIGWHLPAQTSSDYAAMVLLSTILQGDESSRLFQRLVKDKEISLDWTAGINLGLGNEFDYNGPMLLTARSTYKPGHTAEEILAEVDAVVADLQANGVTPKELADAKVRFRSAYYDQLESGFGKANLIAAFTLFRGDPSLVNTALQAFESVTPAQAQAAAKKYLVATNRTVIDRVPEPKAEGAAKGGR
jgi:predicted Zn-dependent peptidase